MNQPDEQAKQNLIAALDEFRGAFGDKFQSSSPPRWRDGVNYWFSGFWLGNWSHEIRSDENGVWLPVWLTTTHTNPNTVPQDFQITPEQFVRVMRIMMEAGVRRGEP